MIALLTDFGLADIYVGVMKAVILATAPEATIVDLTHEILPQNITVGAFQLAAAWPYLPAGAIVVGVVDPGVGSTRRAIAVRLDGKTFVGPDNGLIGLVANDHKAEMAVVLDRPEYQLRNRGGETFHGRDIFAPVAAHLHRGASMDEVGSKIDAQTLVRREFVRAAVHPDRIEAESILIDRFGNVVLNIGAEEFDRWRVGFEGFLVETVDSVRVERKAVFARSYSGGNQGDLMLVPNSYGLIEIALPSAGAAQSLDLRTDAGPRVVITKDAQLETERSAP